MSPITSLLVALFATAPSPARPSPFTAVEKLSNLPATRLSVDAAAIEALEAPGGFTMSGFPLSESLSVNLVIERFEVLAPDAVVLRGSAAGDVPMPRPDVALYRGHVAGDPGSFVYLSISPYGHYGYVSTAGATHILSSGPVAGDLDTVIYDLAAMPPEALPIEPFVCGADLIRHPPAPAGPVPASGSGGCTAASIAVDSDYEFTQLFDGDEGAASAYAITMLGAASVIFTRDAGTPIQVVWSRFFPANDDPWDAETASAQFFQFQEVWNAGMGDVERNAAHLLSGRELPGAGGIGFLPGLCVDGFDYAMSAHLNGFFPYPLEDHHPQNWDIIVLTHELGHNFGAPHTHNLSPPVDSCAFGDCSMADQGTIMSYCHTCEGGVSNIALHFHERVLDEHMLPYLNGLTCFSGIDGPIILGQPSDTLACIGALVTFSVVAAGDDLTYQWRKDGLDIPGATESELTLVTVMPADEGVYDVVVSSTACGTTVSDGATLTVTSDPPGILVQPDDTTACVGDAAIFSVVATGADDYQWRKNGIDIPGADDPTLTVPSVILTDAGVYDVVVSGGCGSVTSDEALLTVDPDCCPWDIDSNGSVGTSDLLMLLQSWGLEGPADIDGGGVGTSDLLAILAHWGSCP